MLTGVILFLFGALAGMFFELWSLRAQIELTYKIGFTCGKITGILKSYVKRGE